MHNCSAFAAEKMACKEFYEGTILEDETAGFIKLNISREEVLKELYRIYSEEF